MKSNRRPDGQDWNSSWSPGDFSKLKILENTYWILCLPTGEPCMIDPKRHTVTEHEDGTITISPSILLSYQGKELWHGYLEKGVFREC